MLRGFVSVFQNLDLKAQGRTLHQRDAGALYLPDREADGGGQPRVGEKGEAAVRVLRARHKHRHHPQLPQRVQRARTSVRLGRPLGAVQAGGRKALCADCLQE